MGLRMNPNSAKGDEINGLIPPKLSKIKVIVYWGASQYFGEAEGAVLCPSSNESTP